jgi:hypothetical protein
MFNSVLPLLHPVLHALLLTICIWRNCLSLQTGCVVELSCWQVGTMTVVEAGGAREVLCSHSVEVLSLVTPAHLSLDTGIVP